ncbi:MULTISPECIES: YicC/YloC family endoribonuclease [Thiomicrorhabdus]|uniref:YicC family protein n=1 Tax=Thiomicrorhabdus heinhorstiae TaxID=2748010 RepID=A0ABS0C3P1_9GAMM|nr:MULTISPECIES: YicC/YloC family endoribonuclease [Thiomicrorhabdus]MBF6058756.1 YicC family protein [Thiomicrorhabdus heinhorstiae]
MSSETATSLKSMTAFARLQDSLSLSDNPLPYSWELRSVNQRYLEIYCKLPDTLRSLESDIRSRLKQHFQRGKIEVFLNLDGNALTQNLHLNHAQLHEISQVIVQLRKNRLNIGEINPLELLKWPGILLEEDSLSDSLSQQLLNSLEDAIDQLDQHRGREGQELKRIILDKLDTLNRLVAELIPLIPDILTRHTDKLKNKIEQLCANFDENRFYQEVAILAQKADIQEELDRLQAHIKEVHLTLESDQPVGRRLDFLMQELNREANTLGSKSIDPQISQTGVEIKVLIEQMREQIQNIE